MRSVDVRQFTRLARFRIQQRATMNGVRGCHLQRMKTGCGYPYCHVRGLCENRSVVLRTLVLARSGAIEAIIEGQSSIAALTARVEAPDSLLFVAE